MGRNGRTGAIAPFKRTTFILMGLTWVVCLLLLPLWVLGVPGVQNEYARGWALGLKTLYHYLIGCSILLSSSFLVTKISQRVRLGFDLNLLIVGIFWLFFIYSTVNLYRAIQIMV